jgi:hypothetical protein
MAIVNSVTIGRLAATPGQGRHSARLAAPYLAEDTRYCRERWPSEWASLPW